MKTNLLWLLLMLTTGLFAFSPNLSSRAKRSNDQTASRLARLVEANVIAVHAYQVVLAKKSGKGDPACFSAGALTDAQLESLSDHQSKLLKSDLRSVKAWAD